MSVIFILSLYERLILLSRFRRVITVTTIKSSEAIISLLILPVLLFLSPQAFVKLCPSHF